LNSFEVDGGKMVKKNVTLRLDGKIYEKYQEFCKRNAIALSRSIENYMAKKVEDEKN